MAQKVIEGRSSDAAAVALRCQSYIAAKETRKPGKGVGKPTVIVSVVRASPVWL